MKFSTGKKEGLRTMGVRQKQVQFFALSFFYLNDYVC